MPLNGWLCLSSGGMNTRNSQCYHHLLELKLHQDHSLLQPSIKSIPFVQKKIRNKIKKFYSSLLWSLSPTASHSKVHLLMMIIIIIIILTIISILINKPSKLCKAFVVSTWVVFLTLTSWPFVPFFFNFISRFQCAGFLSLCTAPAQCSKAKSRIKN